MKTLIKLLLTAVAVFVLSEILGGVHVDGFWSAFIVAIVLALLRLVVKPVLILLTLPITILTFGLFLLVINAIIIMMTAYFVHTFKVDSWGWALLFSLLLSIFQTVLFSLIKEE